MLVLLFGAWNALGEVSCWARCWVSEGMAVRLFLLIRSQ